MFKRLRKLYRQWQGYRSFIRLERNKRRIVFYSEGFSNWPHFTRLVQVLAWRSGEPVAYLTSDEKELSLLKQRNDVLAFYIGDGNIRTILFAALDAEVMVLTMPDLQTFHIKRSWNNVHYVYIHHSMVSCHMIYRPGAFDHFDTVFCVGPHHMEEIRMRESLLKLKPKNLVRYGYGRLDTLIEEGLTQDKRQSDLIHILIAPSWGSQGLLERHGVDFIRLLLDHGFAVTLRPHPQTRKLMGKELKGALAGYSRFYYEGEIESTRSLHEADIMISDWSGAALEFSFSRLKPVLFVDVPRKVNNPDYEVLRIEPLEVFIRREIGLLLPEEYLDKLPSYITRMSAEADKYREKIRYYRERYVYNIGDSAQIGADTILRLAGMGSQQVSSADHIIHEA